MTSQDFIVILQRNNEALLYEIKAGQENLRREFKQDLAENSENLRREFKQDLAENSENLRREIKAGQDELREEFKAGQEELNAKIDGVYTELKADNTQTHAEIRKLQDDVLINRIRTEDLNNTIIYGFSFAGIIVAVIGLLIALPPVLREIFKYKREERYVTAEQVREIVREALKGV